MEFRFGHYVKRPALQQVGVPAEAKICGRREIQRHHQQAHQPQELPLSLQCEIRQQQNRHELDRNRQRHQQRTCPVPLDEDQVDRYEHQEDRQQMCVAIMKDHDKVLRHDERGD
jgi:hypothetical protein